MVLNMFDRSWWTSHLKSHNKKNLTSPNSYTPDSLKSITINPFIIKCSCVLDLEIKNISIIPTFGVALVVGRPCIPLLKGLDWSASFPLYLAFWIARVARIMTLSIFESDASLRAFGRVASTQCLGLARGGLRLAASTPLLSLIGQFRVHLGSAWRRHHGWWAHHGLLLGFWTAKKTQRRIVDVTGQTFGNTFSRHLFLTEDTKL